MSGRGWCLGVAGLAALVLCAPFTAGAPAPGEPSPPAIVTLYAHWHDVLGRAPLNTIPPDPLSERDLNEGFQMPTVVLRTPCGEVCNVNFQNNIFTLYTFPRAAPQGSVTEYDVEDPAYDVELADGPIVLYLYLSAHPVPSQNSNSEAGALTNLGLMPLVQLDAQWETGRQFGLGAIIAAGQTSQTINMVHAPGSDPVYEIVIPMGRYLDTIPANMGTVLTVRVHQLTSSFAEVQQSNWRLRSGPEYPWRLVVPVENPLVKRDLHSWLIDDEIHVRWGVKAAFGAYDLDASTFRLRLAADGQDPIELAPTEVEYSQLHNPEVRTVYAHWVMPFDRLSAASTWTTHVSVANLQATTGLEDEGFVELTRYEGRNDTPGFGLVLALAAAFAIAGARHRRGPF